MRIHFRKRRTEGFYVILLERDAASRTSTDLFSQIRRAYSISTVFKPQFQVALHGK